MKSKIKIIIPLALVIAGGAYKFVLAKPAPAPKPKVGGQVYVLPKEFLINLADGRYAKLNVALIMKPGAHLPTDPTAASGGHGAAPKAPEGYGANHQEAIIRDIITSTLTDAPSKRLISEKGREHLKEEILHTIERKTDTHAIEVLFTDVAVQ